jgi:hypothetical protein
MMPNAKFVMLSQNVQFSAAISSDLLPINARSIFKQQSEDHQMNSMTCEEFGPLCAGIPNNCVGFPESSRDCEIAALPVRCKRHEGPELLHPNYLFNLETTSYFVRPVAYECD